MGSPVASSTTRPLMVPGAAERRPSAADGHLAQVTQPPASPQEFKITLPEPAILIIRYDIPRDIAEAEFAQELRTNEME
jgi:hypothetical protein